MKLLNFLNKNKVHILLFSLYAAFLAGAAWLIYLYWIWLIVYAIVAAICVFSEDRDLGGENESAVEKKGVAAWFHSFKERYSHSKWFFAIFSFLWRHKLRLFYAVFLSAVLVGVGFVLYYIGLAVYYYWETILGVVSCVFLLLLIGWIYSFFNNGSSGGGGGSYTNYKLRAGRDYEMRNNKVYRKH